jgi:DNA-binding Xre family transcriptional regulator
MKASYKRLWKLLIDKEINKKTLAEAAHVSVSTLAKLHRGESVNVDILIKICSALNCTMNDIMELTELAPVFKSDINSDAH